ncbi:speckle-type POZ protein-like [Trichogramma pretiosum]|uniref:speckle-type POZ protein-like n=1 Tax=Trichogramma pretiosum TaxID=7493 RepID=UPI0006C9E324|nr:speckle-type POZ protein-like [Trichogramma pretiosum]
MSSANKITAYTQADKEDCVFTWIINDYTLVCQEANDQQIISPTFNVGQDDQKQFALMITESDDVETDDVEIDNEEGSVGIKLELACIKATESLPLSVKLSIIKDDITAYISVASEILDENEYLTIFEITNRDMHKFISSTGTVIFRCELSVSVGPLKNIINYESVKTNCEVFKLKFDRLFLSDDLSDVKLRTDCGKEIPAHKVVLAVASPVFDAMFSHDMLEKKSKSVDMTDVSYETAVEMLRYIYTGSVEKQESSLAMDVLAAADKYQLEELKSECEQMIGSNLSTENAVDILRVADKHNAKYLRKKAADFIKFQIIRPLNSDDISSIILGMAQVLPK